MELSLVAEGEFSKDMLDPSDVFIVDDGKKVIVWIGSGASSDENKNALTYAHVRFLVFAIIVSTSYFIYSSVHYRIT